MIVDAVIVLYNPDEDIFERIVQIASQVRWLFIINNGLRNCSNLNIPSNSNITMVEFGHNYGVAHAINMALTMTLADWVILFDQDTVVHGSLLKEIECEIISCSLNISDIGLICVKFNGSKKSSSDLRYEEVEECITSGSLIRKSMLNVTGGYDDRMFIDYVDTEFSLRVRSMGFRIIQLNYVFLNHSAGLPRNFEMCKLKFTASNHNFARRYYIMRNRLYTYRKYFSTYPKWVANDSKKVLVDLFKIIVAENDKLRKITYTFLGLLDGVRGSDGPIQRRD